MPSLPTGSPNKVRRRLPATHNPLRQDRRRRLETRTLAVLIKYRVRSPSRRRTSNRADHWRQPALVQAATRPVCIERDPGKLAPDLIPKSGHRFSEKIMLQQ
jgi:hypothetical protein